MVKYCPRLAYNQLQTFECTHPELCQIMPFPQMLFAANLLGFIAAQTHSQVNTWIGLYQCEGLSCLIEHSLAM